MVFSFGSIWASYLMKLQGPIDLASKIIGSVVGLIAIYRFIKEVKRKKQNKNENV
jgi:hypothetical protein